MNRKTYIDKINTIVLNSYKNKSKNPVCELTYGNGYSRVLLQFNTDKIKKLFDDKLIIDPTKVKHTLVMKNCWGLQSLETNMLLSTGSEKERTSSFDLYLVRIPVSWDSGIGMDSTKDGFLTNNYTISENGSNWFNSSTETPWPTSGIFTGITSGDTNLIVAKQHFDIGNEDINFDITNEINSIISGNIQNCGYMICFPSLLEQTNTNILQYVGFFTNNTNTFFKPYVETYYNDQIIDDRNNFYLNKTNRLYFYSLIGGDLSNLDNVPNCFIDGAEKNVIQASKGVYYAEVTITDESPESMLYDIWSNINYNGKNLKNVEMEFVIKDSDEYFMFGNVIPDQTKYIPTIYGINYGEKLLQGQIKKIFISPRIEYTNIVENITGIEYRIFIKDGNREITVIDFDNVNRLSNSNYFTLYTDDLLPNKYFIDIRISKQDEINVYKEKLVFEVVNSN